MRQPMPSTRNGAVVLLVLPCDDGLLMYAEYLCEYGLTVIAVSEPWDALIAAPKADVIVTGILLAGSMDGVELIARLRRDERVDRRPIIVLTACAWDAERERATSAGCDLFLAKPCAPSELLQHVRASLADVALQRVRRKAAKADLLNAPCVGHGLAADSAPRGTTANATFRRR
jgi:DNA-binding response OmpR family regulator